MVIASMPVDTFGKVVYSKFGGIMYKVRYTTIRNAMMEKNATATEKTVMELCREQERKTMEPPASADDEPAYVGMVTTKQLQDALAHQKIGLTRLQVTSVMCDAEILDGMVDYWKFVPIASKTVEQMLDPKNIAEKAAIMEKASIKPEDYLGGRSEEQVRRAGRVGLRAGDEAQARARALSSRRCRPTSSTSSTSLTRTTAASSTPTSSRAA